MDLKNLIYLTLIMALTLNCGGDSDTSIEECNLVSNPNPSFTVAFTDLSSLEHIDPLGEIQPGQLYSDHTYIHIKQTVDSVPVYAPTDMELVNVVEETFDYAMHFKITQEVELVFGHITDPIPEIRDLAQNQYIDFFFCSDNSIMTISAGQLLGYTRGTTSGTFDLGVYNSTQTINFINPARFEASKIYINASCPFDYYIPALKTEMYDHFGPMPVTQPLSCRDSRDKPGTIAGAWFDTEVILDHGDVITDFSPLLIATALDGHLKIARGEEPVYRVFPNEPTYQDPESVTTEHCYSIESGGYFYFQLQSNGNLRVASSASGTCPGSFPASGFETYYR